MKVSGADFNSNLKESKNIAVVVNTEKGLEGFCAAVALTELINTFLSKSQGFNVSTYYLSSFPLGSENLVKRLKVKSKIGEKTVYIKFPIESVSKVTYDYDDSEKEFKIGLVGVKGKTVEKEKVNFKEQREKFDMCIGVGFASEDKFANQVPYVKKSKHAFVFNKKNLGGTNLVDGVIQLYFSENVKPNRNASLAFFTFLSSTKGNN